MRRSLSLAFCLALFLASVSAASEISQDETIFTMQQAAGEIEAALRSKNFTNTKSAVSSSYASLETLFKHNNCYWMISTLINQLEILPFKIQEGSYGFLDAATMVVTLDSGNRDCFPIVNFARKLVNKAARALNVSQQLIPRFRGVSFDVDASTTAGKTVLVIEDVIRFGECAYAAGLFSLFSYVIISEFQSLDLNLLYPGAIIGFEAVEGCKEAVQLAHEVFAEVNKECNTF